MAARKIYRESSSPPSDSQPRDSIIDELPPEETEKMGYVWVVKGTMTDEEEREAAKFGSMTDINSFPAHEISSCNLAKEKVQELIIPLNGELPVRRPEPARPRSSSDDFKLYIPSFIRHMHSLMSRPPEVMRRDTIAIQEILEQMPSALADRPSYIQHPSRYLDHHPRLPQKNTEAELTEEGKKIREVPVVKVAEPKEEPVEEPKEKNPFDHPIVFRNKSREEEMTKEKGDEPEEEEDMEVDIDEAKQLAKELDKQQARELEMVESMRLAKELADQQTVELAQKLARKQAKELAKQHALELAEQQAREQAMRWAKEAKERIEQRAKEKAEHHEDYPPPEPPQPPVEEPVEEPPEEPVEEPPEEPLAELPEEPPKEPPEEPASPMKDREDLNAMYADPEIGYRTFEPPVQERKPEQGEPSRLRKAEPRRRPSDNQPFIRDYILRKVEDLENRLKRVNQGISGSKGRQDQLQSQLREMEILKLVEKISKADIPSETDIAKLEYLTDQLKIAHGKKTAEELS